MSAELTRVIKEEARRLGFPLAGVTTPEPPPHWPAYENWLAMGRHASMNYLADERARACRRDPRRLLPECRSILVLGIPYAPPQTIPPPEDGTPRGRVASYAWGQDYHLVLPERLRALVAFIEAHSGGPLPHRLYTDTGPLLERDLAQRAGLGWIGKNTCLIHPRFGSTFFLAEILLGLDLEPDPPFEADRCGTCRRCIEACPTGCILPDRSLDARACLSYLTIENKGEIPPELRPALGEWVFGCDICQAVCPWNRFAPLEVDPAFAPHPGRPRPDLIAALRLDPSAFRRQFADSPVQRARRRGYLRNAAVALANSGRPEAAAALAQASQDADPLVRAHAAWGLEQISKAQKRP
ncbi:MAG: tRNA epoxyqueuosine(34) reductase QueG [Anaerolineales bacterium]